jgi:RNA recognition motif-containing protein
MQGYALVEYEEREDAEEAIKEMDGEKLLGVEITCNWAFVQAPSGGGAGSRRGGRGGGRSGGGRRSSSRERKSNKLLACFLYILLIP